MRRSIALSAILLIQISLQGLAQSTIPFARTEVFAGVSALSLGGDPRTQLYGWQAGMTTNFLPSFGIASDFAGQYKDGINVRQSLFGPRFNKRWNAQTLFGHALVGTTRSAGANALTLGLGGGFDLKASNRFVFRIIQADWLPARSGGNWEKDRVRLGSAVIISFRVR